MIAFTGFNRRAFTFLTGLERNNRRDWFEANRETYESEVRAPMRALVDEMDSMLGEVAPEFRGDPRRSVFRIHRDVRFSANKSPYKTHIACWLFHEDAGHGVGQEAHGGAGFYLHIQPGECMSGGGLWMPPKPALDRVRKALADDLEGFNSIVTEPRFRRRFGRLSEEAVLTRTPRGYQPDHPAAEWLRYKSFTAGHGLKDSQVASRGLLRTLRTDIEVLLPFVRWLNSALGLRSRVSRY